MLFYAALSFTAALSSLVEANDSCTEEEQMVPTVLLQRYTSAAVVPSSKTSETAASKETARPVAAMLAQPAQPEEPGRFSLLRITTWLREKLHKGRERTAAEEEHSLSPRQVEASVIFLFTAVVATKSMKGFKVFGAIIAWTMASICMNLFNKQAAEQFPATCLLVILQMLITDITIIILRFNELHWLVWRDFVRWLPVPCIIAAMLASSLFALKGTTVSTVLILRNILPIITFALEKSMFNNPPTISKGHWFSMVATLAGTLLYGVSNLSVTMASVSVVLLGCILTVADKLLQRYLLTAQDFKQSLAVCMLLNNTVGMLPLFLFAVVNGELWKWQSTLSAASSDTWLLIVATGLAGCCLGYFGLEVAKQISAASVLMLQNASKVVIIWVGVLIFADEISGVSAVGCAISMLGSAWYGYEAIKCTVPKESAKDTDSVSRGAVKA